MIELPISQGRLHVQFVHSQISCAGMKNKSLSHCIVLGHCRLKARDEDTLARLMVPDDFGYTRLQGGVLTCSLARRLESAVRARASPSKAMILGPAMLSSSLNICGRACPLPPPIFCCFFGAAATALSSDPLLPLLLAAPGLQT